VNGGVWRELEECVRDWAFDNKELYITSGPIFYDNNPERIGQNKVAVPDAFYKVILDYEGKSKKSIAFLIPHRETSDHLKKFAVSIDEIEEETGLDFYPNLYTDDNEEEEIESEVSVRDWKFNEKRFKQRVKNWNKR